jgi:putative tributyrin esterase
MALLRCDFFSDVLGLSTSMTVILPQHTQAQIGLTGAVREGPPPVLYLLHGLSDDDTTWVRRTSLERYVAPLGLAVVMPQVHRSFYLDEAHGNLYWTFLSEELPGIVGSFFRVSDRREDTFVAGLSMGGYGAMKWALRDPGRFAAAASLSGALDLSERLPGGEHAIEESMAVQLFGERLEPSDADDPMWLIGEASQAEMPALYVACGTEDFLYGENISFVEVCRAAGVPVTVDFGAGEHDWGYWDARIQDVLAWLPLDRAS